MCFLSFDTLSDSIRRKQLPFTVFINNVPTCSKETFRCVEAEPGRGVNKRDVHIGSDIGAARVTRSRLVAVAIVAQVTRHARARRVAEAAAVGCDRVSRAAVRRQVVRGERERRVRAGNKATARRDGRHLAVVRRPALRT